MTFFDTQTVSLSTAPASEILIHLRFSEALARHKNTIHADWYSEFFPMLSLCKFDQTLQIAPPILMVGSESSQAQLFGQEWSRTVISTCCTPVDELDQSEAVISGYRDALVNDTSQLELCTSSIRGGGHDSVVHYYKTVARIQTCKGQNFYAYLGTLTKPRLQ